MKNVLVSLGLLSLIFIMTACPRRADEVPPVTPLEVGTFSVTVEGVTYSAEIDYTTVTATPKKTTGFFNTFASGHASGISVANTEQGFAFTVSVRTKAIDGPGDYALSPTNETGEMILSLTKNNLSYKQLYYKEDCKDSTPYYTTTVLGISKVSTTNLFVQGTFSGKLTQTDGEFQCSFGKVAKWKQVDITGAFKLRWAPLP